VYTENDILGGEFGNGLVHLGDGLGSVDDERVPVLQCPSVLAIVC
jgi:hypothetical protein